MNECMGAFWTPLDGGIRPLVFFFREVDFLFLFCWSHADGTGDGQERIGAPKPISPTMWPFILGQNLNHRSANILGQRK